MFAEENLELERRMAAVLDGTQDIAEQATEGDSTTASSTDVSNTSTEDKLSTVT